MAWYAQGYGQEKAPKSWKPAPKWVIVDPANRQLDELHFRLPDRLRADTPEEVQTVVHVTHFSGKVRIKNISRNDSYEIRQNAGSTYVQSLTVTVYDPVSGTHLFNKEFDGSDPHFAGADGKPDEAKVLAYLLAQWP